jgi:uncharacterized protein
MIAILIAGFTLGFAGSLHCVGMCGPLSLALPTWHLSGTMKMLSLLLYQFGRIVTYAFFGLVFGLMGRGLYIAGVQQWFSVTMGMLLLLSAALYFVHNGGIHVGFLNRLYVQLSKLIGRIVKSQPGAGGFLLLGMANGLLPCGMVYIALAATMSFYKVYQGIGFMVMFGAGTLPAMMLVGYGSRFFNPSVKRVFRKSIPFFITATGIILILRGLNLGIAFISPVLPSPGGQAVICH